VRRTPETIQELSGQDEQLRDPLSAESVQPSYVDKQNRAIKAEILVLLGLCTHLGCAPKYRPEVGAADLGGAAWKGGFFCPCHGSKFDLAGRVMLGVPAPYNLEVPPHSYEGESVLVIGVDKEAA
jgi:ubiquinol-cytochrome c reductase iron-sulfur subunit